MTHLPNIRPRGADSLFSCRCPHCKRWHVVSASQAPPKPEHPGGPYAVICPACLEDGITIGTGS